MSRAEGTKDADEKEEGLRHPLPVYFTGASTYNTFKTAPMKMVAGVDLSHNSAVCSRALA